MYEKLHPIEKRIFDVLACVLVLFYSYTAVVWYAPTEYHRGVYVLVTYVLIFLTYKFEIKLGFFDWGIVKFLSGICRMESLRQNLSGKFRKFREDRQIPLKRISRAIDVLFILLTVFSVVYWIVTYECFSFRYTPPPFHYFVGVIGVLVSIEVARRVVGVASVIICIAMLACGVYGFSFPEKWTWLPEWVGMLSFNATSFSELCASIFIKSDGIFGIMASVAATHIIIFVLFGAFWQASGAKGFVIDFPMAVLGHKTGGPAKVAVVASGLSGSFAGNAANNLSATPFTISTMKQAGYPPHIAGGVKATGSFFGLLMPPFMGAGVFIMAELCGMPCSMIMSAAIFPALMYIFSVLTMMHFQAKIHGFKGQKSGRNAWEVLKAQWVYAVPPAAVFGLMLAGYPPASSATIGIAMCIAASHKTRDAKIDLTIAWLILSCVLGKFMTGLALDEVTFQAEFLFSHLFLVAGAVIALVAALKRRSNGASVTTEMARFVAATRKGVESSLKIGATIGFIGIVIGVLTHTGLVLGFCDIMISLYGDSLFLTIILIAFASLVLGMGIPVLALYVIIAIVAVPALTHSGINEVAAHMIVYWLALGSNIASPVCAPVFSGATIAGANRRKTALALFKFAQFLYIGPFLFGYVPGFSLDGSPGDIVVAFALILAGTFVHACILSLRRLCFFTGSPNRRK